MGSTGLRATLATACAAALLAVAAPAVADEAPPADTAPTETVESAPAPEPTRTAEPEAPVPEPVEPVEVAPPTTAEPEAPVEPAAAAAPGLEPPPPVTINPSSKTTGDYLEYLSIRGGDKDFFSTVEVRRRGSDASLCSFGSDVANPTSSAWNCEIPGYALPYERDRTVKLPVEVLQTGPYGDSTPVELTLTLSKSQFRVTSPKRLPPGDTITLTGLYDQEFQYITFDLEHRGRSLTMFKPCEITEPAQGSSTGTFTCVYEDPAPSRRATATAADVQAAAVANGGYTATISQIIGDGAVENIEFDFQVAPAPSDDDPDRSGDPRTTPDATTPATVPPAFTTLPAADPIEDPTPAPAPESTTTPSAPDDDTADPEAAAAPGGEPAPYDPLRILLLGVVAFTILGMIGSPGLGVAGRFAPGSTRTGGGATPGGTWPVADRPRAAETAATALGALAMAGTDGSDDAIDAGTEQVQRWGDRSPTWRAPGRQAVDAASRTWPHWLASRFPLLARAAGDADYLRAALGSVAAALPVVGLLGGVGAALAADGLPLAPSLAVVIALIALGLLDASAGLASVIGFTAAVALTGGLTGDGLTLAEGVRGLIGLTALWFVVPLVAGAARPFRRLAAADQVYRWDRLADTVVAALLCGWAAQGVTASLGDLVGREQTIVGQANWVGLATIALVALRFALEETVAAGYPRRLAAVNDPSEPPAPSTAVTVRGIVVRAVLMAFFAGAFIGACWQLWVGVALFVVPAVIALVHEHIPDSRPLVRALPKGVVKVLVTLLIGAAIAYTLAGLEGRTELSALRDGFVLLAIPGFVLSVWAVLGGEPPEQRWTWPRQLTGAAVVVTTVVLVLLVL